MAVLRDACGCRSGNGGGGEGDGVIEEMFVSTDVINNYGRDAFFPWAVKDQRNHLRSPAR